MNPNLFRAQRDKPADTTNLAGGRAYSRDAKEALAQFALTGTLGDTFYARAGLQLDDLLGLLAAIPSEDCAFIAKCAVYARQYGYMKDVPAFLVGWLAYNNDAAYLAQAFNGVVDNGKMLKNVVQVCRSGVFGRRSIPRPLRRLISKWLCSAKDIQLVRSIPGKDPSLADVIKMVHPKGARQRSALFSWILGKLQPEQVADLPQIAKDLDTFRANFGTIPFAGLPRGIPFQLVDSLPLKTEHWTKLAIDGGWHFTRMNLNTFLRHGVFEDDEVTQLIANKLRDEQAIREAKVFPYQLLAAFLNTPDAPYEIRNALQDAMELAVSNVPVINGQAVVLVDVSGSMQGPVTGRRHNARGREVKPSNVKCVDVAALFASAYLRKNPHTQIVPFDGDVRHLSPPLNPRDSIMTNAQRLAMRGGITAVGRALGRLNEIQAKADAVIVVSDNESWADSGWLQTEGTRLAAQWRLFKRRNRGAKLVCIDITPEKNVQIEDKPDSLNIGGFSDNVWTVVDDFLRGELTPRHVVGKIEQVQLSL